VKRVLIPVILAIALGGCELVFTASPLAFLERDPAAYSDEQLRQYARDALAAGDTSAMLSAYELLKESDDPADQLLAVDCAIGAGEIAIALSEMVAGLTDGELDPEDVLNEIIDRYSAEDLARFVEAAYLLDAADAEVTPSAEEYAFVAFCLIAAAADDAGGIENLDPPPGGSDAEDYVSLAITFLDAAVTLLDAAGESPDLLEGFGGAVGWSP
jgi:hypothetical protein